MAIDTKKFEGHTPGPWFAGDRYIRSLPDGTAVDYMGNRADMELLAAAPDLLVENQQLRLALANSLNAGRLLYMAINEGVADTIDEDVLESVREDLEAARKLLEEISPGISRGTIGNG